MLRRVFSLATLPFLLAVVPTPSPSVAPDGDHVFALAGTSTCRTMFGTIVHRGGKRDGDRISVAVNETPETGNKSSFSDQYTFDRTAGLWHVRLGAGSTATGEGTAPAWTGDTWDLTTHDADGPERLRYQLLPGGELRRTTEQQIAENSKFWRPINAELCTPGDVPPAAGACIAENFPAYTTSYGAPTSRINPGPAGAVLVVVSLDAQSRIASTRIQSTPNPNYNAFALETVHLSTFQTQIRDCKPIAADYIFSVGFW